MPTSQTFRVNKYRGFTLIELLVTISIIAILATIAILTYQQVLKNSRDAKRQSDLKLIQSALEQYRSDQGFYPNNVNVNFDTALQTQDQFTSTTGNPSPPASVRTYLKKLTQDPLLVPTKSCSDVTCYQYVSSPTNCSNNCTSYCLYSKLETSPGMSAPAPCTFTSPYNFVVTPP